MSKEEAVAAAVAEAEPARPQEVGKGKAGPGRPKKTDEHINRFHKSKGGTSSEYLAARLKRDAPDVAARAEAGEFRSVRAAAIEAGIIKPLSPVQRAEKAVRRASPPSPRRPHGGWVRGDIVFPASDCPCPHCPHLLA